MLRAFWEACWGGTMCLHRLLRRRFMRLLRKGIHRRAMRHSRYKVIRRSMCLWVGIRRSMELRWVWGAGEGLCGELYRRLQESRLERLRLKGLSR